jgi:hypothetical protein
LENWIFFFQINFILTAKIEHVLWPKKKYNIFLLRINSNFLEKKSIFSKSFYKKENFTKKMSVVFAHELHHYGKKNKFWDLACASCWILVLLKSSRKKQEEKTSSKQ